MSSLRASTRAITRPSCSPPRLPRTPSWRPFTTTRQLGKEIQDAYIISGSRTPTGAFNGALATLSAPALGATAIRSAISKSNVPIPHLSHVYMGQVLQGGSGQSPARQASIAAGLPTALDATTVNKVCASGLKAVALAAQSIQLGRAAAAVAGGMESMTRVPYYLPRASQMPAFGGLEVGDGLIVDGLWDVYNGIHMGSCAEATAKRYGVSRESQDAFAVQSYRRAQEAWRTGAFEDEVVAVVVKGRAGEVVVREDEQVGKMRLEKMAGLKPVFDRSADGTITAANSSPLSDGASALVLGSVDIARAHGATSKVLARIVAYADAAVDPIDFPVAPAKVVPMLLAQSGLNMSDIKLWEFNEAFAAVIRANAHILGLGDDNVNMRGGAIALGHALGSSGSRILVTLLHQLKEGEFGVAAICNGGGAATGMLVQRIGTKDL